MKPRAPVYSIRSASAYERFTYTLRPEFLESATPNQLGGSIVDRVFFYDEIQEVYRYRVIDWGSLARICLEILILGGIGLGILTGVPSPGVAIAVWILALVLAGYEVYRGFIVKKPMVRVVGNKQSADFICRSDSFFDEMISRLRNANSAAASRATIPGAPGSNSPLPAPPTPLSVEAGPLQPTPPPPHTEDLAHG